MIIHDSLKGELTVKNDEVGAVFKIKILKELFLL